MLVAGGIDQFAEGFDREFSDPQCGHNAVNLCDLFLHWGADAVTAELPSVLGNPNCSATVRCRGRLPASDSATLRDPPFDAVFWRTLVTKRQYPSISWSDGPS